MKARRTSECIDCAYDIKPGDEITKVNDFGWIHQECADKLDEPVTPRDAFFFGPEMKTYRDIAERNVQYDLAEADTDDTYPGYWANFVD
jgi:hypothetical protein